MNKRKWLYLVVSVLLVVGVLISGCAAPVEEVEEEEEEEEVEVGPVGTVTRDTTYLVGYDYESSVMTYDKGLSVEGMKPGEEDIYFDWKHASPFTWRASEVAIQWGLDEWFRLTKGHLNITMYYKMMATYTEIPYLLGAAVFEVGYLTPCYHTAELPSGTQTLMPFWLTGNDEWDSALSDYALNNPWTDADMAKMNIIFYYPRTKFGDYDMALGKHLPKITTAEGLAGYTCRAPGYYGIVWEALDMVPVFLTSQEIYEGMQKGIIDCQIGGFNTFRTQHLEEVSDKLILFNMGGGNGGDAFNLDYYNMMPDYMMDIWLSEISPKMRQMDIDSAVAEREITWDLLEESGVDVYEFSAAEFKKVAAAGSDAWDAWVDKSEDLGFDWEGFMNDQIAFRDSLTGEHWFLLDHRL